jgi:Methyltransferase domain
MFATIRNWFASPSTLGKRVEELKRMDAEVCKTGDGSHTTPRFRYEVLYFLLDNNRGGPIIEVGTMNGGMTCLLSYIARETGRKLVGIDINHNQMVKTIATCQRFGLDSGVRFFDGTLEMFLASGELIAVPDLVFLDSSHDYNTTIGELRLLHSSQHVPRVITCHDYSYRHGAQESWFRGDLSQTNPIAVDHAITDFFRLEWKGEPPVFKRIGGFTGDGTQADKRNKGALMGDYMEDYGCEGMMIIHR